MGKNRLLPGPNGASISRPRCLITGRYLRVNHDYGFALRVSGGVSEGRSPATIFRRRRSQCDESRSGKRGDRRCRRRCLLLFDGHFRFAGSIYINKSVPGTPWQNLEFRYPLIRIMALGWPLPAFFYNIRGATFVDCGTAWNKDIFRGSIKSESGSVQLKDMLFGFGFGARASLGFAVLKYDIAWQSDWMHNSLPQHYLSLGTEF